MEDIAIVGVSFKMPEDAQDELSFWKILEERKNLMTEWPESRTKLDSFFDPDPTAHNTIQSRGAHFLRQDPLAFDAPFFSIRAEEAASMDPQHRLTLETAYAAFENAGMPVEKLRGSQTAVFAVSMADDYTRMLAKDPDRLPRTAITGIANSILANRLSWYFDLRGPSVHVDTACSGSMVALNLAVQSLHSGDADMALVAGSNLMIGPEGSILLSNGNFLSPDSVCYSFDHRANGYARGEAVVGLVIKKVSAAIRDGDMIRAVIRSIGCNQDGHTPGMTQPSAESQEQLIRHVYGKAGLGFDLTRFVEAHGTGTPVGDPIEMKGIGRVFRPYRSASEPLYVGSLKANTGHLEGSAGVAGVIKAVFALERGVIPPNALFERMNPSIDAEFYNIKVPVESTVWPTQGLRRISVSSYGFGGTNAHVVIDDAYHYLQARGLNGNHRTVPCAAASTSGHISADIHPIPPSKHPDPSRKTQLNPTNGVISNGYHEVQSNGNHVNGNHANGDHGIMEDQLTGEISSKTEDYASHVTQPTHSRLLVWSAPDEGSLRRLVKGYLPYYQKHILGSQPLIDQLAFTLSSRRSHMLWRTFALSNEQQEEESESFNMAKPLRSSSDTGGIAFVFTGQGAQYVGMGLELLQYPIFAETLRQINEVFRSLGCDWDVNDELRHGKNIDLPEYSQPLCTAIQVALVELMKSFGITPSAVIGHSSGEIAAAYTANAFGLITACKIAYYRGQLASNLKETTAVPGAMLSANLSEGQVDEYLENAGVLHQKNLAIHTACINSPLNLTLSGPEESIDEVKDYLDERGIFTAKLKTGVAYHSPAMRVLTAQYIDLIGSLRQEADDHYSGSSGFSEISMVSSVTGKLVTRKTLSSPQYWADNLVSPVRFSLALDTLTMDWKRLGMKAIADIIEIGPHAALKRPIEDTLAFNGRKGQIRYASALHKARPAHQTVLKLVGQMFCHGHPVSIQDANQTQPQEVGTPMPFLVDCPEYPFDHSRTFSAESRMSRDYRLREHVPRDILGARAYDWNPLEPRWRRLLNLQSTPWSRDHAVTGTILYPGAGMLMMAIEAAKQMCPVERLVGGFLIKEAHFLNPIVVGETWEDTTEVVVRLLPLQKSYEKESVWSDIRISTLYQGRWTECFTAIIHTQYKDVQQTQVDGGLEKQLSDESVLQLFRQQSKSCNKKIDSGRLYEAFDECGIVYGETFRLLDDITFDGQAAAMARVDVSTGKHASSGVAHPAILDCAFQLLSVQQSQGLTQKSTAFVPTTVTNVWVSPSGWQFPHTSSVRIHSGATNDTGKSLEGKIHVVDDNGSLLCAVSSLTMSPVSSYSNEKEQASETQLLYGLEWNPQLSLLDAESLHRICEAEVYSRDPTAMTAYRNLLDPTLDRIIRMTVLGLTPEERQRTPEGLQRQLEWMDHFVAAVPAAEDAIMSVEETYKALNKLEEMYPPWNIYPAIARNLRGILIGETDPLQIGFDTGLAQSFYSDVFASLCDGRFRKLIELLSHEKPVMRIIEVGAGTGGMTAYILSVIAELEQRHGGSRLDNYTYTDISPSFFESARERFSDLKDRIVFKTFDLEHSAQSQGLELGSYDIVVAGSVMHATASLAGTLQNVRSLLKPGGHLLFLETTVPKQTATNFVFGNFPGWWQCTEEWRQWSPAITEEQWGQVLRENGFSDNRLVLRDYESDMCHCCSIMLSTVSEVRPQNGSSGDDGGRLLMLVPTQLDQSINQLAQSISGLLKHKNSEILSLAGVKDYEFSDCDIIVSLLEACDPFLERVSEEDFLVLKDLIKRVHNLMWVTTASGHDEQGPRMSLARGFLRAMRSEHIDKRIISLAFEFNASSAPAADLPTSAAACVASVFKASFEEFSPEVEYHVRDGETGTLRLVKEKSLNEKMRSLLSPQMKSEPWRPGPPLKLTVRSPGFLDSLEFVRDPDYRDELLPREIEVEAKTWGLSFRDVFVALGRLPGDELGYDYAGVVSRVGPGCDGSIKPGDRVCGSTLSAMRMYARTLEGMVVKVPDQLSLETAASFISPGITAYYSLIKIARLQKGEKVLIHSGSGSTGQMAIWVAKMIGAEVFATVGFDEKKELLVKDFGIPDDHIFYSRNTSFAQGVMRVTNGYGVDVVLNSLAGDGLRASFECMAPYGRFVEIGKADITANSSLPMASFARNVSFSAVDLFHIAQSTPSMAYDLLAEVMDLISRRTIHPPTPLHVYPASNVEGAFRYLQSGTNTGRIIISVDDAQVVPKRLLARSGWTFDKNATYVIAGGLGGLGRAIAAWMASKGARHLVLLSRSGPKSKVAATAVAELREQGVQVLTPCCDASSAEALCTLFDECRRTMPPIKGCINSAMVLQDSVFDNMTRAQWETSIRSKVQTSWNLHALIPNSECLDFFVLLSSLAGIYGTIGQSNYASGCTYQDALAQHRTARGQKAASLDIGWMRNIGVIAENATYQQQRQNTADMNQIEDTELMALLDLYCDPQRPVLELEKTQLLVGVVTPADLLAQGQTPPALSMVPLFAGFAKPLDGQGSASGEGGSHTVDFGDLFRKAASDQDRADIVVSALIAKLARALSVSADDIEHNKQLHDYGVDSLMAVELRNWIARDFAANVAVFDIMGGTKIAAIGEMVVEKTQFTSMK